ncbi:MAG: metalloregulator ArsR/SmtB family transcription factor [Spirochaetes bacterium]|nr:metalloregulator ArsR/SmtB family transcription factor [Spirochaetota bacterium]
MDILNYFKALADITRLRLLNLLIHFELNVNEIVSVMGMGQPRISRHLKILLDSGLLNSRRDGLWIFYSAVTGGNGSKFIKSIKPFLNDNNSSNKDIDRGKAVFESRKEETIRFFDSIADNWTELKDNIIGSLDFNSLIDRYMYDCDLAVDVGCGNGDLIPQLLKHADNVIGVDRSGKMLDQAKKILSKQADRVNLRLGEIEHLPLKDNEADTAIANMVLHHLSVPGDAIIEIHRILRQNGNFILIDLAKHTNELMRTKYGDRWLGFNDKDISEWLIQAGFFIKEKSEYEVQENLKIMLFLSEKK